MSISWYLPIISLIVLGNAGTWTEIDEETEEKLEELQLFYIRLILQVPVSTPKTALRSETGLMSMRHRVEKEKLMLVHHLRHLDERTLARQTYNEQVANKWPGLAAEASIICERLKLDNVNNTEWSKTQYKNLTNKALQREDEILLRNKMEGKTKVKDLVTEDCKLKDYFRGSPWLLREKSSR